jgi:hypothetical protein
LEIALDKSNDDAELRAQLLGYYQVRKAQIRDRRLKAILWMIDNRAADPITASGYCQIDAGDDPAGYGAVKVAWDRQLGAHSTDPVICANGAAFRSIADFHEAQGLMQQAIATDPKNAIWPEQLAIMDEQQMKLHPADAGQLGNEAVQLRQSAYNLTSDPAHRFHVLLQMPDDALQGEDYIQAKRLGRQLIGTASKFPDDPCYGDAIHRGNIVLGEASLQGGMLDRAEEYLTAAGATPGSPTLATTGPDLHLAKALLARGERTAVHDYLMQCTKFWKAGNEKLKAWITTLDSGGTPDL